MSDAKLIWIFIIGAFLAFLFYLEEIITQNEIVEKIGIVKVIILVATHSVIGSVVMVTTYYGLVQFAPDWHDYFKVGISGMTAMLGKDFVHLYYKLVKSRVEP
jgi:hypothetical protein